MVRWIIRHVGVGTYTKTTLACDLCDVCASIHFVRSQIRLLAADIFAAIGTAAAAAAVGRRCAAQQLVFVLRLAQPVAQVLRAFDQTGRVSAAAAVSASTTSGCVLLRHDRVNSQCGQQSTTSTTTPTDTAASADANWRPIDGELSIGLQAVEERRSCRRWLRVLLFVRLLHCHRRRWRQA